MTRYTMLPATADKNAEMKESKHGDWLRFHELELTITVITQSWEKRVKTLQEVGQDAAEDVLRSAINELRKLCQ